MLMVAVSSESMMSLKYTEDCAGAIGIEVKLEVDKPEELSELFLFSGADFWNLFGSRFLMPRSFYIKKIYLHIYIFNHCQMLSFFYI